MHDLPAVAHAALQSGEDAMMFELAPVSLWLEDYSAVKILFDAWRAAGISDLRAYFAEDAARIAACAAGMQIVRVNRRTLIALFEATDLSHLSANLGRVFRDDMLDNLAEELVQLWDGKGGFVSNGVNYSLGGRRMDIQVKGTLLPGFEIETGRGFSSRLRTSANARAPGGCSR